MKIIQRLAVLGIMLVSFGLHAQCTVKKGEEWTGTWNTKFGKLIPVQNGNRVSGQYQEVGKIDADYDFKTKVLSGTFTNKGKKGKFKFQWDCNAFTGKWGWRTNEKIGSWSGFRKKAQLITTKKKQS